METNGLPQRVVHIDFGDGPRHPAVVYTAPPDIIQRFLVALRKWNPDYTIEVESVDAPDENVPSLPCWRLWAWNN